MDNILIDIGLYLAYGLLILAVLAALVFPIMYIAKNPGESKYSLISIAIIIVIFLIGYVLSTGDTSGIFEKYGINPSQFKVIGGGLIVVYVLAAIAVVSLIYSEIKSLFR